MKHLKQFENLNGDKYTIVDIIKLFAENKLEVGDEFIQPVTANSDNRLRVTGNKGTDVKWLTHSYYIRGQIKKNEWTMQYNNIAGLPQTFTKTENNDDY